MSKRALQTIVVVASLLCAPACSIVFDPVQYRGDGGPPGPDAPRPDAPVPDAPGLDAAVSPTCDEPSMRTALPTCGSGVTDLTYCAPTAGGAELTLEAGAAPSILGGPGTYLLDTLGNNHEMVAAAAGTIPDHAIALSPNGGLLTLAWLENQAEPFVARVTHAVTPARLELGRAERPVLTPAAQSLSSLAVAHDEQLVVGETSSQSTVWRCEGPSCPMAESRDLLIRHLAAYGQAAGDSSGFVAVDGTQVAFSRPEMNRVTIPSGAAMAGRLVGTDGPLVFSPSAGAAFFHTGTSVVATPSTPPGARVAHQSGDTSFVVASLSDDAPLVVSTAAMTCTGSACSCAACGGLEPETNIVLSSVAQTVVDWTFEVTDDGLRVAVLLVANAIGETDVLVAAWRAGSGVPVSLVHLASGVGFGGEGRSIRSVVHYVAGERLEVFVSALVHFDADTRDRIFLSGMRLLRCP